MDRSLAMLLKEMKETYIPMWKRWGFRVESVNEGETTHLSFLYWGDLFITPIYLAVIKDKAESNVILHTIHNWGEIAYPFGGKPKRNPQLDYLTRQIVCEVAYKLTIQNLRLPLLWEGGACDIWLPVFNKSPLYSDADYYRFAFVYPAIEKKRKWEWKIFYMGYNPPDNRLAASISRPIKENPIKIFLEVVRHFPLLSL
jgi:hypothetical protein